MIKTSAQNKTQYSNGGTQSSEIARLNKLLIEANANNARLERQLLTKCTQVNQQINEISRLKGENEDLKQRMRELRSA